MNARIRPVHWDILLFRALLIAVAAPVFLIGAHFAHAGVGMSDLLRLGNAAGAIKTGIVGHMGHITKNALVALLSDVSVT